MDLAPIVEVDADLADLIPPYLDNRWADLRAGRELLVEGEFAMLSRMGHRVRGSAASYGFGDLGIVAEALEAAANAQDGAAAAAQLDAFETFLRSVRIEYV